MATHHGPHRVDMNGVPIYTGQNTKGDPNFKSWVSSAPSTHRAMRPGDTRYGMLIDHKISIAEAQTDYEIQSITRENPATFGLWPAGTLKQQEKKWPVPAFDSREEYKDVSYRRYYYESFAMCEDLPLIMRVEALIRRLWIMGDEYSKFDLVEKGLAMCHDLKFKIQGDEDWRMVYVQEYRLKNCLPPPYTWTSKDDYKPNSDYDHIFGFNHPEFMQSKMREFMSNDAHKADKEFSKLFGLESSTRVLNGETPIQHVVPPWRRDIESNGAVQLPNGYTNGHAAEGNETSEDDFTNSDELDGELGDGVDEDAESDEEEEELTQRPYMNGGHEHGTNGVVNEDDDLDEDDDSDLEEVSEEQFRQASTARDSSSDIEIVSSQVRPGANYQQQVASRYRNGSKVSEMSSEGNEDEDETEIEDNRQQYLDDDSEEDDELLFDEDADEVASFLEDTDNQESIDNVPQPGANDDGESSSTRSEQVPSTQTRFVRHSADDPRHRLDSDAGDDSHDSSNEQESDEDELGPAQPNGGTSAHDEDDDDVVILGENVRDQTPFEGEQPAPETAYYPAEREVLQEEEDHNERGLSDDQVNQAAPGGSAAPIEQYQQFPDASTAELPDAAYPLGYDVANTTRPAQDFADFAAQYTLPVSSPPRDLGIGVPESQYPELHPGFPNSQPYNLQNAQVEGSSYNVSFKSDLGDMNAMTAQEAFDMAYQDELAKQGQPHDESGQEGPERSTSLLTDDIIGAIEEQVDVEASAQTAGFRASSLDPALVEISQQSTTTLLPVSQFHESRDQEDAVVQETPIVSLEDAASTLPDVGQQALPRSPTPPIISIDPELIIDSQRDTEPEPPVTPTNEEQGIPEIRIEEEVIIDGSPKETRLKFIDGSPKETRSRSKDEAPVRRSPRKPKRRDLGD